MKEYAIWGIPQNKTEDTLLKTMLTSWKDVENWLALLESFGCTALRVQTIDFAAPYNPQQDFINAIRPDILN